MFIAFINKLIFIIGLFIFSLEKSAFASDASEISFFLKKEKSLSGAIIRLSVLLGGRDISVNLLINGLDENVENKKLFLIEKLKILAHKNILKLSSKRGDYFITLNLEPKVVKAIFNDKDKIKKTIPDALHILNHAFNKDWEHLIEYINSNPSTLLMAESFLENLELIEEELAEILPIQIHLLEYYMYATREHQKAIKLMNRIENNKNYRNLSPDLWALFISNKANLISTHFSSNKNLFLNAIDELEKSFYIFLERGNYEEALRILSCWMQANVIRGNLEKAIELLGKGENLVARVDRHRYKAIFFYVSSWCYLECGDYERGIQCADKAIYHLEFSIPTPLLFFSYNLKADALFNLSLISQASEVASLSLEKAKVFDSIRPADWKAESMVTISKCFLNQNNYDKAEEFIDLANTEYKAFFKASDKHIDQAAVQTVKGKILMLKGKDMEAKECFQKSLNIYSQILKKDSWFDEQGILYELLARISKKLGNVEDILHYWKVHKDQFGSTHPRTIRIRELI